MMTKASRVSARYDEGLESKKFESTEAYYDRRTSPAKDSGRTRSSFSRPPSYENLRPKLPMSTVQNSELPASAPLQAMAPRSLLRAADLMKKRSRSPLRSGMQSEQPKQSKLKKMASYRVIPLTEARRQRSDPLSPPLQTDPLILSESHRDLRPVVHKSCPASGRDSSKPLAPTRKRSVSTFRESNIQSNPASLVLRRPHYSSCNGGQRTSEASGQGYRQRPDITIRAECELQKEVQGLREKLQAIENEKRSQESKLHHLLSEQWKTMEELLKEKCSIINRIKVVKAQSLGQQGEERLLELLEKQEQYEREIEEAESQLLVINEKVATARREKNLRLKEEMWTLKNMENALIHQRKWYLLQRAIKQAMRKYHEISRAANDLGGQILNIFQLRKEFYEKYENIKQQMKSRLFKDCERKKFSSAGDTRKDHWPELEFSESETSVGLDKLAEDIAELQKLVYSSNFLRDSQNDDTRIKNLIPKDAVTYPVPVHIKDGHDRQRLCETALQKFIDLTNISDVNMLWNVYKELEKKNFELLQSVHDLNIRNHEMHSEDEDQALQVALREHKDGLQALNLLRKKIHLQNQLEAMTAECEKLDSTCDEGTETILAMMQRIDKILRITGCYTLAKYNVFGTHRPLTYENVAKYLAVLKERVREILQLYSYHVKNASLLQKNKESQNIFACVGTAISSSSPQLKTHRLLTEKESPIACPSRSSDTTKTPLVKRKKTLAEMQAEIDAVRKRNSKTGVFPQTRRENADLYPKGAANL